MSEERDPPIEPLNYLSGVTVVNIGDVRVARGMSRRAHSSCPHRQLVYDKSERRIWCSDCEHDVEPFDGFLSITEGYSHALKEVERRETAVSEAEKFQVRSIAAKQIDKAWRSHKMLPCCPYCHNGLWPEDFKHGMAMVGKDFARARSTNRTPP